MTDTVKQPIVVSASQGGLDILSAAGRLLVIVLSTAPAAALLLRKHDLVGLYNYFHSNQGTALLGALGGLASLAFGLYKSYKRGAQVATVAVSPDVPDAVATTKDNANATA